MRKIKPGELVRNFFRIEISFQFKYCQAIRRKIRAGAKFIAWFEELYLNWHFNRAYSVHYIDAVNVLQNIQKYSKMLQNAFDG